MNAFSEKNDSNSKILELTISQHRIWTGQMLTPDAPLYNMAMRFDIEGEITPLIFNRAFQAIIDRSDSFRTTIIERDGIPLQQISDTLTYDVEFINLSAAESPAESADNLLENLARQKFILTDRLFESILLKLADERYVCFINQHHLICDAWSFGVLFERLGDYYQLALEDRLNEVMPGPQFFDYQKAEKEIRHSKQGVEAAHHWADLYSNSQETLELYGRRVEVSSTDTVRVSCDIGRERSKALQALAGVAPAKSISRDLSIYYLFSALTFIFMHRVSGVYNLVIGSPNHNRSNQQYKNILGLFVELFPLRIELENGDTFRSVIESVIPEVNSLLRHAQPGASENIPGDCYSVVLNYLNVSFGTFGGMSSHCSWLHTGSGDRGHAMRLQVHDFNASGSFKLLFDLNERVFPPEVREHVADHFLQLLDALLKNLDTPVNQASLLSRGEIDVLLRDYNDTSCTFPEADTVLDIIAENFAKQPDAVAISEGSDNLTYRQLDQLSTIASDNLRSHGVESGHIVAVYMDRSASLVISLLAIMKTGAAFVPIDSTFPDQRLRYVIEDSGCFLVLTGSSLSTRLPELNIAVADFNKLVTEHKADTGSPSKKQYPDNGPFAYVIYTSGSTGRPKGVMIEHRSMVNYLSWARKEYMSDGPFDLPLFSSIAADLTITSLFLPLMSGGRIVVYPEHGDGIDLSVIDVFEDDRVDIIKLTPSHLSLLPTTRRPPSRLKKLILGGEDFKSALARKISDIYGGKIDIYNEYGPTEATVGCMTYLYDPESDTDISVAIGHPIANLRVYLLDASLNPVPVGAKGDMYIAGAGLAKGYLNQPEMTAEKFINDPFYPGERMYRSGDIGRWRSAGVMDYLGRGDGQVKIRGHRIECGEIEAAICKIEEISDAFVQVIDQSEPIDMKEVDCCRICGLPANVPRADLDEEGVCGPCRIFEKQRHLAEQYFKSENELKTILQEAKANSRGPYDCLMQYSGGKDSTYALCQLVEMGMNPLVFSFDNGYIPESVKENIHRIVGDFGLDLEWGTTPAMKEIFVDSLHRYSDVCNGCQRVINTMSITLADKHEISHIFTGLSRGQSFETRVADLLNIGVVDMDDVDKAVIEARKAYHSMNDAVTRNLDQSVFEDETVFDRIHFVDFYRYIDIELAEILNYLKEKTSWTRPADTGRSTNCLINEAGIYIHKKERGYHNYASPYSWDVRLGHKERDSALVELDDNIDESRVEKLLQEIGYSPEARAAGTDHKRIAAYYVGVREFLPEQLRETLGMSLPPHMIPSHFIRMDVFPLNATGKVDRYALPLPGDSGQRRTVEYEPPRTTEERTLAAIWERVLGVDQIGIKDNFFDLGGDSILNIQIVLRAEKAGIRFTPAMLFQNQTIEELAQAASTGESGTSPLRQSPGEKEADSSPYPLTPMQAGMLFHTLKEPASGMYVEQYCCTLSGQLDLDLFQKTWGSIVQEHPVLRTSFRWDNPDQPLQIIDSETAPDWHIKNLEDGSDDSISKHIESYLAADRNKGFLLSDPPLLRFALFKVGDGRHRFIWSFHHIICDGWSTTQVIAELVTKYHAQNTDLNVCQSPDRPFRDYVAWIHEQDLTGAERFWKNELKGIDSPTPLPTSTLGENRSGYGREELCFSGKTTASLTKMAQAKRLTLNTLLQGAWAVLLHHYSGEEDVLFGTTVSGRPPSFDDAETMIGLFINTLPVRVKIDPDRPLSEWLTDIMKRQIEARNYEYTSLVDIQKWSEFKPTVSLFESIVVFENVHRQHQLEDHQLDFTIEDIEFRENSNFPISIIVLPGECLNIVAFYNENYFSDRNINQLLNHLQNILLVFVENPDQQVKSLPLLSAEEIGMLAQWQSGPKIDLSGTSVLGLFEEQALTQPEKHAVICNAERSSYREINIKANRLAHYLLQQDFPPATYHGIYLDRSIDMVIAMLAVLKSGATYVPLDPAYPQSRIEYMLADAKPATILTVSRLAGQLPPCQSQVVGIDDERLELDQCSDGNPAIPLDPERLAYVIYTSGSTGNPKGVMITHQNLSNSTMQRIRYYHEAPERFLLLSSISFDSSVAGIYGTLCQGGCLHIPEQDNYRDVGYLADLIKRERITHILAIPSLYQSLLQFYAPSLQSLRTVIVAGETCFHDLVENHRSRLPNTRLFNEYGPTEATVWSSVYDCSSAQTTNPVPIGSPIGNMQLYVLDRWFRQVPPGVTGELYLGGDSISPGYLNQPELTSERFLYIDLPGQKSQRLYKSGDLTRYSEHGALQFLGRNDEQIKMRGYRIELGEIESALKTLRNVHQAVVIPKGLSESCSSSHSRSSGIKAKSISGLAAFIQCHPGEQVTPDRVKSALAAILPAFMVPNDIIVMDSLPLNPSGKVDRQQLPKTPVLHSADQSSRIKPGSPMEKDIAGMWCDILGVDRVYMSDNFFDLGGHSLMAVRMFAMIKNLTGLDMPLATLFISPTLRELVDKIDKELNRYPVEKDPHVAARPENLDMDTPPKPDILPTGIQNWEVVVPIKAEGTLPPLFLFHSLFGNVLNYAAMNKLDRNQPVYAFQAMGLDGYSEPFKDMQKMVNYYLTQIQKIQPQGPYLLGGWSVGGVIALELAHLLQMKGERILFLGMFDTMIPDEIRPSGVKRNKAKKQNVESRPIKKAAVSPVQSKLRKLPNPGILGRLPFDLPNNRASSVFSHISNLLMCKIYKVLQTPRPQDLRSWYLLYSHMEVLKSIQPREYDLHISYFRSAIKLHSDRPDCGWGDLTRKGVDVIQVPTQTVGNRFLQSPEFIAALDACLKGGEVIRHRFISPL